MRWVRASSDAAVLVVPIASSSPQPLAGCVPNVWELVDTAWSPQHPAASCCAPLTATGAAAGVAKGGSFLCSGGYCYRYRAAARIPVAADSPTAHVGFRCAGPSR